MRKLPGYKFDHLIHKRSRSCIFRGTRLADGQKVIIKTHVLDLPSIHDINRFRREFEIGKQFDDSHVVNYFDIEFYRGGIAIIQEDFDAVSLKELIPENGFDPVLFLKIALISSLLSIF